MGMWKRKHEFLNSHDNYFGNSQNSHLSKHFCKMLGKYFCSFISSLVVTSHENNDNTCTNLHFTAPQLRE